MQVCRRFLSKKTVEQVPSQKPNSTSSKKQLQSVPKTADGNYSTVRSEWKHYFTKIKPVLNWENANLVR